MKTYPESTVPVFDFPPLGATGEGDPPYPNPDPGYRDPSAHGVWTSQLDSRFCVVHQHDRPACAFRCYYPGGGAPCDLETACRFIAHVTACLTIDWVNQ